MFQTAALAFLFVPISTVAYMTLPRELNGDGVGAVLDVPQRVGSIGIALSTAMVTQRAQTHQKLPRRTGRRPSTSPSRNWSPTTNRRCWRWAMRPAPAQQHGVGQDLSDDPHAGRDHGLCRHVMSIAPSWLSGRALRFPDDLAKSRRRTGSGALRSGAGSRGTCAA